MDSLNTKPISNFFIEIKSRLFEGPTLDIAQIYANVLKTMLFTAFYATLVPMGAVFSLISVIFLYWVMKYLLLRRFKRPLPINQNLAEEMVDYLELFFVVFSAGNIFFEYKIRDTVSATSFACLGISLASYILPWKAASHSLFTEAKPDSHQTYDEARINFYTVKNFCFLISRNMIEPIL